MHKFVHKASSATKISHMGNELGVNTSPTFRSQVRIKLEPRKVESETKPITSRWLRQCDLSVPVLRAPAHSLQLLPVSIATACPSPQLWATPVLFLPAAQKRGDVFDQHLKFRSDCNVVHRGKNS